MAMFNGKKGRWITTDTGRHVFIEDGQTVEEALKDAFDEEYSYDEEKKHYKMYKDWIGYKFTPTMFDKDGFEFDVDLDKLYELFQDENLSEDDLKYKISELFLGQKNIYFGAAIIQDNLDMYNYFNDLQVKKYLSRIPKLKDNSIDNSYKKANDNGYVESMSAPYGTLKHKEYTNNCQRCVIAYEMRRRGYDVEADKWVNDGLDINQRSLFASFKDIGRNNFKNYKEKSPGVPYSSRGQLIKQMEKDMLSEGEGARFILRWTWKNNNGNGHTVNAEIVNGQVKIYDAQNGKESNIQDFIDNKTIRATTLRTIRVDKLKLKKDLGGIVKWNKES